MEQKQKINRRKKGGRPQEGGGRQAEIPSHGEDGDIGLLHPERQGSERRHICRGIPARVYEKLPCEGTAHARTHELCPQAVRLLAKQSEPDCAQGECRSFVTVRVECRVLVARIEELLNLIFL